MKNPNRGVRESAPRRVRERPEKTGPQHRRSRHDARHAKLRINHPRRRRRRASLPDPRLADEIPTKASVQRRAAAVAPISTSIHRRRRSPRPDLSLPTPPPFILPQPPLLLPRRIALEIPLANNSSGCQHQDARARRIADPSPTTTPSPHPSRTPRSRTRSKTSSTTSPRT